jgi:hypothetical protein
MGPAGTSSSSGAAATSTSMPSSPASGATTSAACARASASVMGRLGSVVGVPTGEPEPLIAAWTRSAMRSSEA